MLQAIRFKFLALREIYRYAGAVGDAMSALVEEGSAIGLGPII